MTSDFYDKKILEQISKLLTKIHKICIDIEFKEVEKISGPLQPNQKLHHLLHDEKFAWLRPVSQLISLIDGVIFQKVPVEEKQIAQLKTDLKDLLSSENYNKMKNSHENLKALNDIIVDLI